MSAPRRIALLGSTGSIGTQTVDVVRAAPERFRLDALCSGGGDPGALADQVARPEPPAVVGVARAGLRDELTGLLRERLGGRRVPEVVDGPRAAETLAGAEVDTVLNAVAGDQGLRATLAGLAAGRTVALANKESLIAGGPLVLGAARPGQLVPVDSEHSALAQALRAGRADEVRRLVVTASGGPFRGRRRADLADVTPAQARWPIPPGRWGR